MSRYHNSIARRVVNSVSILSSAQAIALLCSVVRTKCIALWLGTTGIGFNSILVNGSSLITTISQLNIRDSSVRDVASVHDIEQRRLKCAVVRRWALILGMAGAILMILAAPLLSMSAYNGSLSYAKYFAWLWPFVFFSAYSAGEQALMQAEGKMKSIARTNITAVSVATAATIVLIYTYGLSAIVPTINVFAICIAICSYCWRVKLPHPKSKLTNKMLWSQGRPFLVLGASMAVSVMLAMLAQYAFAAYINTYGGESDLGIYQSGYTVITSYVGVILNALSLEYYPRLASIISYRRRTQTIISYQITLTIALLTPIIVIFISCSDLIVKLLYSSSFESIIPYVNYAVIGTVFRGISLCYVYRILAAGDSRTYLIIETLSTVIGLSLNIWAYSRWSLAGLGGSYIAWYGIYAIITGAACRILYNIKIAGRHLWLVIIATASGTLSIWLKYTFGWWMPLCILLPLILPLSFFTIFRKKFSYGKPNAMV